MGNVVQILFWLVRRGYTVGPVATHDARHTTQRLFSRLTLHILGAMFEHFPNVCGTT